MQQEEGKLEPHWTEHEYVPLQLTAWGQRALCTPTYPSKDAFTHYDNEVLGKNHFGRLFRCRSCGLLFQNAFDDSLMDEADADARASVAPALKK